MYTISGKSWWWRFTLHFILNPGVVAMHALRGRGVLGRVNYAIDYRVAYVSSSIDISVIYDYTKCFRFVAMRKPLVWLIDLPSVHRSLFWARLWLLKTAPSPVLKKAGSHHSTTLVRYSRYGIWACHVLFCHNNNNNYDCKYHALLLTA